MAPPESGDGRGRESNRVFRRRCAIRSASRRRQRKNRMEGSTHRTIFGSILRSVLGVPRRIDHDQRSSRAVVQVFNLPGTSWLPAIVIKSGPRSAVKRAFVRRAFDGLKCGLQSAHDAVPGGLKSPYETWPTLAASATVHFFPMQYSVRSVRIRSWPFATAGDALARLLSSSNLLYARSSNFGLAATTYVPLF